MKRSFWHKKRVLITGHTGFKGSWLCLLLQSFGAAVAGFALEPPTKPSLYDLARVDELVSSKRGDVRDLEALTSFVSEFAPDVVFHMAAQSIILRSYDDPVETYSTNVLGTVNTLEAVRRMRRPCVVVNVTTDKCYENRNWVWGYREGDMLGGRDPYSNSKACAELVAKAFRDSFFDVARVGEHGVALASARAGNVIGGGDWTPRQLVPDTIAAFLNQQPVVLRHPQAVRPWQHVLDCLTGYMTLAEGLGTDPATYSGDWNFGPDESAHCSVSHVVELLASIWEIERPWVQDVVTYAHEEQQLRLDVSKAARYLQWHCLLSIEDALQWVSSWYRDYHDGRDARDLCLDQIGRYFQSCGDGWDLAA
jgi:CDP-glucose 4,6-dehydratase